MFSGYQQWEEYEDELYCDEGEEDSGLSDPDSELEFQLYSQLHYSMENHENQCDAGHDGPDDELLPPGQGSSPPSPAPVEVITIDSDHDAITISDNTEDEDSVCTLKGQRTQGRGRMAKKGHLERAEVRNVTEEEEVVVVLDSEADSEESSDSRSVMPYVEASDSESDGLESWMILGQEKEEGDQDIQLNLSAVATGDMPVFVENTNDGGNQQHWVISEKDKEAQIFNKGLTPRRMSNRYYTNKSVTCRSCDKVGHLSKNCPNPKKLQCCLLCGLQGHWLKSCPNRPCSNCSLPGHSYDVCLERPYWHKRCHRCCMTGHFINACPEIWRQYHLTTAVGLPVKAIHPTTPRSPAYCYNCSKKGHFGHECSERRMFNGTYPTLPLICSYDTLSDIRRRAHWTQKQAYELQQAGLLEITEAPPIAQPFRKKRKPNPKNTLSSPTPAVPTPKRRIAHTPKHHPQWTPTGPNGSTCWQQGVRTPTQKATPPLQSAFTPQLQGKKKKKKKNLVVSDGDNFPRGPRKSGPDGGASIPMFQQARSPGTLFGTGKSKKKKNRAQKRARKAAGDGVGFAPDENLFNIKQRKRRR